MISENIDLSSEEKLLLRKVVEDPVLFATHVLGAQLWKGRLIYCAQCGNFEEPRLNHVMV